MTTTQNTTTGLTTAADPNAVPIKNLDVASFQSRMRPALDQFVADHQNILQGKTIDKNQAVQDMFSLVHGNYALESLSAPAAAPAGALASGTSSCPVAIATCAVDCLAVLLQVAGVPSSVTRTAARAVIDTVPAEVLTGWQQLVRNVATADSTSSKAKAIFALVKSIYTATGIRQILGAIEHDMAWYEWVLMGTVVTAQLTIWFASDGLAAIAEIALLGAVLAQTVADAALAVKVCGQT